MTQGPPPHGNPPGNADSNDETVALRRGDLPPQQQYGPPPQQYGPPQQQHGPPPQSYGQSPQGSPWGAPPPASPPAGRGLGAVALVLALLGAAVAAVGLFAVRWTKVPGLSDGLSKPKFLDLRKIFVAASDLSLPNKPSVTIAYFQWAAFVLLGVALLFAILSSLPTGATPVFRVLGFVVGLVSAAAAVFVPALDDTGGLSDYLKGGFGLYLVAGGSVLMAIGAVIGSRRRS